jgi:hypothetical protein
LNKASALVASNISIPPVAPFIIGFGLILGHWMVTGERLSFPPPIPNTSQAFAYVLQLIIGSVVLGIVVAVPGTVIAYVAARLVKRK